MHIDPRTFSPGAIDAATRAVNEMLEKLIAQHRAELALHPGGVHGFKLFPNPLGQSALRRSESFLAEALSGESP